MEHASPGFTFAAALAVGVACQLAARHLRVPGIVLLLAAGVALGADGLGWIEPRALGDGLLELVSLAVAVILFEGGLALDLRALRLAAIPVRRLITLGALLTVIGGALASHLLLGWPIRDAVLFGTLVIVTGPTVVRPLLRNVRVRQRLATVLEAEGLLIDPVGAIVAAVTLQVVLAPSVDSFASGALGLASRVAFGGGAGLAFGFALVGLLRWHRAIPEGLENLVALGAALVTFAICEEILSESGILAVTVAGAVVGNMERRVAGELGEFQEQLTIGLIGILFVLLAADVRMADVLALGGAGLGVVAVLALVVRPLGVWLATAGEGFEWRERAFLSWVAPRGVVAAAVASLAAVVLEGIGANGSELRALVFLTIGITVVVQGGTAPLIARLLGVRAPGRDAIIILGADELGFALADLLRTEDSRVLFTDSNPQHCLRAAARGFPVVRGDVLDDRTMMRMRLERARLVVGITPNTQVNQHFAGDAREEYDVREGYVAVAREGSDVVLRNVERQASRVLFDRPKDVDRWNVRLRLGQAEIRIFSYSPPSEGDATATPPVDLEGTVDPFLVLAVCRGERWAPMFSSFEAVAGDQAGIAVHRAEEEAALRELAARGWTPDVSAPPGNAESNAG
jgi:NhaP-type Na+/H+ or K+/H+ antiporter